MSSGPGRGRSWRATNGPGRQAGDIAAPHTTATSADLEAALEQHRKELTGYCYRMLGSAFEADDAVQETMVRAWRSIDGFEGRSSLRSWLYRIATNVCLNLLRGRQRRALPMDMGPASSSGVGTPAVLPASAWVEPIPDARVLPDTDDPAELALARDTVRLAFVTALQALPARQRAVLILREVLRLQATEVAELLDTTVASVNSALQRARATLAAVEDGGAMKLDDAEQELLDRYVDAFERYDIDALVSLLHEEARFSMPPYPLWFKRREDVGWWMLGPGAECRGSIVRVVEANGQPAMAQWRRSHGGGYHAWAIQVMQMDEGAITDITAFVEPELFALFGLPLHLDDAGAPA